jgi:hypothetical protein
MVIDEVSMIDLSPLSIINNHYKSARSLDRSSPDLFGGLPVVILMGDFCQFPPVRGQPLWKIPQTEAEHVGKLVWQRFNQVIILDKQMRQVEDDPFRKLLQRARTGTLTHNNLSVLNARAIDSLTTPTLKDVTTITRLNSFRQIINRLQIDRFARSRLQKIYIFPALHTRTKSSSPTNLRLHADDLLGLPEQGTTVPSPGLFLYTLGMPIMLLTNVNTPAGLVNGATGAAVGVVVNPVGKLILP